MDDDAFRAPRSTLHWIKYGIGRTFALSAALVVLGSTAGLAIGEVALRAHRALVAGTAEQPAFIERDARLGWRAKATNYEYRSRIQDANRNWQGVVTYSSLAGGFLLAWERSVDGPKLLVIGDSYTQATSVSTEDTYPALLGEVTWRQRIQLWCFGLWHPTGVDGSRGRH